MLSTAVQILAFVLSVLGLVGVTVSTVLPNWKVSATAWTSLMTPISHMQGLWMDCNFYSSGVFSCTMKSSMLSLPPHLQMTRIAMVLAALVTGFGICLASLGLKCTKWGGSRRAKAHTAIAAGACFVLASVLCLAPASWFTSEIITTFLTTDVPESSRYQPGGALCLTFVSAGFLLASGVIFCLSCPKSTSTRPSSAGGKPVQRSIRGTQTDAAKVVRIREDAGNGANAEESNSQPEQNEVKDSYSLQEYV
ncbi:claudin-20-like [Eucyclogobius newberryi]|uniref:claudin-20-like n=1 Tax=Eucyclogobius newberryi TaxID=166745 RepID=UPI003B5BFE3A